MFLMSEEIKKIKELEERSKLSSDELRMANFMTFLGIFIFLIMFRVVISIVGIIVDKEFLSIFQYTILVIVIPLLLSIILVLGQELWEMKFYDKLYIIRVTDVNQYRILCFLRILYSFLLSYVSLMFIFEGWSMLWGPNASELRKNLSTLTLVLFGFSYVTYKFRWKEYSSKLEQVIHEITGQMDGSNIEFQSDN